jgi:S-adenosylmethionine hydrolase
VAAGRLVVGDREVTRVVGTYGDAPPGTLIALVGSQGVIEAAVVQGRADDALAARIGTRVVLP